MSGLKFKYSIVISGLLILFILSVSCSENIDSENDYNSKVEDSISFYLNKASNEVLNAKDRGTYAMKAYLLTHNLNDSLKPQHYINIGNIFAKINDYENYKNFGIQAFKKANELSDEEGIAKSSFNLGLYYTSNNYKSDSAYYYFHRAERAYIEIKDTLKIGNSILNMGIIQRYENDLLGGQATIIRSIPYFEVVQSDRFLSSAYNALGNIDTELGDYENAIKNHQKALEYRRRLNNKIFEVKSLNNIAVVYKEQKMYNEAVRYYNQVLEYNNLYNEDPLFYAMVLNNLADVKFRIGDKSGLPELFFRSLKIKDSLNDTPGIVTSKLSLAEYYVEKNKIDSAKLFAYDAKDLAERLKIKKQELESLSLLSRLESGEKGLTFSQRYIQISDSLQKQERTVRNQFARIRFDTDQITQEYEKVSRQKQMLIFSIAILFTLGLLVYIIVKQMSQNKELRYQQQQQQANEEIYNLMLSQQVKLEEGRQMEKERISRDLHDGILGNLFGTRLSLESLIMRDDQSTKGEKTRHIMELKKIEQEIRNISHDLSTELFTADIGYVEVVEKLIKTQTAINNLQFEFHNNADIKWERISSKVKIHLYRIVQEALQNINKHAKAKNIKIELLENKNNIHLEITDDGVGFKTEKSKNGIGLKNIESRVNEISGKLKILSKKDKGTTISIDIPFQ